ncbi:RNA pyrophosphohydrolase [Candidatus Pelagibacter bacterium]|nr:RNA pyrophosphohydrolase [Candidatus Pelagibacter bacterium]
MLKKNLPLRIGVGAIVLNNNNKIFVGKRKDNPVDKWQMPQGGVNKNENFITAMRRELEEETSIKSIEVLKTLDNFFVYELPKELLGIIWKGKFRGQKQKWFIVRFKGEESEINLKTKHPEFIEWKWIDMSDLPKVIVDFKKRVYENLLIELKRYFNSRA